MATKKQDYGNDSISALKGADRVRKRPGVIFGSDGLDGCQHAVFEILSNSIDEAREGHGKTITVTRFADRSIQVEDMGRGCPVDWNEKEQRYNWELVYCELYAGGKYDNLSGDNYEYSLGLNGLGACATQYASRYMDVTVWRDGFEYHLHFERGELVGQLEKTPLPKSQVKKTGTRTRWLPDLDVFTDIAIPAEYFADVMKRQAVVNAGITFRLRNETEPGQFEETEFLYENGIADYVSELAGEGALTAPVFWQAEKKGRDRADKPEYKVKLSTAVCFSNKVNVIEHYHNSSWLEHGGSPEKATKSAFVSAVDKYLRDQGKYQKNESKVTWADIEDCLVLVSNNFSTQTSYENQTKKAITNKFVQEAMTEFLRSNLEIYFIENPFDAEKIGEQVLINKRSRESAEKQRLNIKKKLSGNIDIANRVQKFVDCRSKDPDKREIYIVEGDSALGSVKQSRDAEYQGIMPVRGKILNCLKADYARIFKSEIITDLIKVLGCGVEVQNKHVKDMAAFDLGNLRWNKVIICTDGDVDGFQIRTLILTMLYRLTPTLIREGYVYIAETPLFEINSGEKTWFAYSDKEKNDIVKTLEGKKFKVDRSKGLGENEPDMMWLTTMNPETRRLIRVMPEDVERTAAVFDLLLGDNLQGRKDHIAENGYKYLEMADIS
ncbi:DNA gyrase/topoisomerase IV subunit B [Dysosmobacter sp.]|uniref:DNA gyrase/topoisomerase IV subunit B n=1 Tax=Dysosmobacter sp. TaxID=2591382 RepID=UPI002A9B6BD7|nr:toprim domain-containing protein [Dysosmobacter sp.]MCI6054611.1 toprim domain-containing protein [Dysosmobacter sp.]MDY5510448.1 toprim domain-containing protein [Dysosmobacter sp.]